ncbi:abortive phage infection protein [Salininema proteolyticum]|uniref:Abortive phage infection protein n=1 Tax=Salininema proteolyticum TaxID=1607685 RepID=A0ABV8TTW4_9ACTN
MPRKHHRPGSTRPIWTRRGALAGALVLGAIGATTPLASLGAKAAGRRDEEPDPEPGLRDRGVCYTVKKGDTPSTAWSAERMREDIRAVDEDLHANAVKVTGDGVERLAATAEAAAERGLHLRIEPTLADRPRQEILDHLAEVGAHARELRRQGAGVEFSVGCEFYLFVPGIIPGSNALERVQNLLKGNYDPEEADRETAAFIADAARTGRSVFDGPLSYASAQGDAVDWDLFDIIGIDYYAHFPEHEKYVRQMRSYHGRGKPVVLAEFGCVTYEGAPQDGGMGWNQVDYTVDPPMITGDPVRSERAQADYVGEIADAAAAAGLRGAYAFDFVEPASPHVPDEPVYDLDTVSYGLVKPVFDDFRDPESDWHWEPKEAFRILSERYARARKSGGTEENCDMNP